MLSDENIHLVALYTKKEALKKYEDTHAEMHKLHLVSAEKYLRNTDETITLHSDREVSGNNEMFEDIFEKTYNLWKLGNNVLFTDIDTLFVKPVDVFGRFKEFKLFWQTCVKHKIPLLRYPKVEVKYLNCGVRYFPREMREDIWDLGFKLWEAPQGEWDWEQRLYNEMLYAQFLNSSVYMLETLNEYNWQVANDAVNSIPMEEACILHFYASRGPHSALSRMKKIWEENL